MKAKINYAEAFKRRNDDKINEEINHEDDIEEITEERRKQVVGLLAFAGIFNGMENNYELTTKPIFNKEND